MSSTNFQTVHAAKTGSAVGKSALLGIDPSNMQSVKEVVSDHAKYAKHININLCLLVVTLGAIVFAASKKNQPIDEDDPINKAMQHQDEITNKNKKTVLRNFQDKQHIATSQMMVHQEQQITDKDKEIENLKAQTGQIGKLEEQIKSLEGQIETQKTAIQTKDTTIKDLNAQTGQIGKLNLGPLKPNIQRSKSQGFWGKSQGWRTRLEGQIATQKRKSNLQRI